MINAHIYSGGSRASIEGNAFHSLLLCGLIFLTTTLPSEYYSGIFLIVYLVYRYSYGASVNRNLGGLILPIVFMVFSGAAFSLNNDLYGAGKDLWYAGKAIVCLLLGYHIAMRITDHSKLFTQLVWVLFISSIIYLGKTFTGSIEVSIFERSSLTDRFALVSAIVVPLIIFRKASFSFQANIIVRSVILFVVFTAFALSFSRTAIGCLLALTLSCAGLFDNRTRLIASGAILGCSALFVAGAAEHFLPNVDGANMPFLDKASKSMSEIFFTGQSELEDMLLKWRGYEAYRAYLGFVDSDLLQKIFGRGWGATVDLGLLVQMSDEMSYEYIPVLHNGYLHILTKYGLVGLALYILFLWRVSVTSRNYFVSNHNVFYARITTGLGICLVFTTGVITGILNKENLDAILVVLGVLNASAHLPDSVAEV